MKFRTLLLLLGLLSSPACAQTFETPLFLVDGETTVQSISFRFDGQQTFDASELESRIATTEPGLIDRIKRFLPFIQAAPHMFSALELQRDVARLRQFYDENGFPHASITYGESRLDEPSNRIRIVFSISEGDPVLLHTVRFRYPDGSPFPRPTDAGMSSFSRVADLEPGDRYSETGRIAMRSDALAWLKDHGYAFATVRDTVVVDSTALRADLAFTVDPGPLSFFDQIQVDGNESVSRQVILRELPFRVGQRFSDGRLRQGQREVFGLNLFRTALTELPPQPVDSSVHVVVRVREGRPQLVTYRLGYGRESGTSIEGTYAHRNFLGAARTFSATIFASTGLGGSPSGDRISERRFRATAAIRQPYLFNTRLSGTASPFIEFERDQQISTSERRLGINAQEFGLTTLLLFEPLPFRTVGLQHTWSRAALFGVADDPAAADHYNRSVLSLTATLGRTDDYVNPSRGVLLRPTLEMAGRVLGSGVQYYKSAAEATGYTPLGRRSGLAIRLAAGRLWPKGNSVDQEDPIIENRFDPIRFYAGGGSDVRGWGDRLAGPKRARPNVVEGDTLGYVYEAVGGLTKLAGNMEVRLPFPGMGPNWSTAVFLDGGGLGQTGVSLSDLRFGTGAGIRYRTPVGYVRLDLAYKLNPDAADLRSAEDYYVHGADAEAKALRRFKIHLSIGQAY